MKYFINSLKLRTKGEKWDNKAKRIAYAADRFTEEELELDEVGLGRAISFIKEQKKKIENVQKESTV